MPAITEKKITAEFKREANKLIKKHGKKALYSDQIDKIAVDKLGPKFVGVFPQDAITVSKPGYYVINTDTSDGPGIHWVAVASTGKNAYIYDSFGRPSSKLLKNLTKSMSGAGIKYKDADGDAEQFGTSEICGPLCISWLMMAQKYGVRPALRI